MCVQLKSWCGESCRTLGRCIVNVGFFAVTCVGDRSILSVVWSMLVPVHDVGVGSMLGFAQSILGVFVLKLATCAWLLHGPLYGILSVLG
jgi:hypothetical protein